MAKLLRHGISLGALSRGCASFLHESISRQQLSTSCGRNVVRTPLVFDQDKGGVERVYDVYSRLLRDRIICLMGTIDDDAATAIIAQLLFLQSESKTAPIHVYINSRGGSVTAGLAIYDTFQLIPCQINTWCIGQACSMASLLLAAGSSGQRVSLPNARVMIHQPHGQAVGQASDIVIHANEILKMRQNTNEILARHTGQPLDVIENAVDRDNFMSPAEAKQFGIVDQVMEIRKR